MKVISEKTWEKKREEKKQMYVTVQTHISNAHVIPNDTWSTNLHLMIPPPSTSRVIKREPQQHWRGAMMIVKTPPPIAVLTPPCQQRHIKPIQPPKVPPSARTPWSLPLPGNSSVKWRSIIQACGRSHAWRWLGDLRRGPRVDLWPRGVPESFRCVLLASCVYAWGFEWSRFF